MAAYIFRRLMVAVPTFLIIVALAFILTRLAPGGPFDAERPLAPEIKRNIMAAYHMDKSIPEQLVYYLGDLARGDLGPSMKYKDKTVAEILAEGFPVSAIVGVCALVLATIGGAVLGAFAALRQNKPGAFRPLWLARSCLWFSASGCNGCPQRGSIRYRA
jgi:oligopeptide transport system permease protein